MNICGAVYLLASRLGVKISWSFALTAIFRDQLHEEHRVPVDIWDEMVNNYKLSLQAIVNIRRSEDDFKDEMSLRVEEEQDPALWHSAYDVERHPRAAAILKKAEQNTLLQKPSKEPGDAVFDPQTFDWVSPYMAAYGGKEVTSLDDAVAIRTAVLEDMRERLLYTANALQKSHEDEFNRLQILNGKFRKAQVSGEMTPKEYIAYENEKSGIQFKMHMLERRQELLQYEGPAKLKRLNDWILKDPRFADWLRGLHLGTGRIRSMAIAPRCPLVKAQKGILFMAYTFHGLCGNVVRISRIKCHTHKLA